ncbi:MAG: hypothetical protein JWQ04_1834 [Pedosphaera sp.]|nr:hypothetical protein [Pedosphaera sp.]
MKTIHAVYEHGVFRPLETVELAERTEVEFEPRPVQSQSKMDENLEGIYTILSERYQSGERDVAERHDDILLAQSRALEPRESVESVKRRLKLKRRRNG